ncbi:MAG TPA: 30S ribosome-binding factor RbfA [Ferrovibrio sp.]|jgi:ribosome-binding factor A|uniref:30S ribosome-binding factor RbfA n=1 Tax=Ferrovibrio sp. TaxID=1917215 RepID=UPI002B4ABB92|nr:30S ribosome-binding factor RbfA [Ferrovibrio sp.]HLT77499.1 30S ribosome-binding factor RbfA [Ferrovibrio sp.]
MAQRKRAGGGRDELPGGRSQRQLRVGEELRHILSDVLRNGHFRDPDLADLAVTVTEVRVSPDLRAATAFIMPLGGKDGPKIIAALNRAQAYIRTEAVKQINLRVAPTFSFKLDHSFDEAERVSRLLQQPTVRADIEKTETPEE